ncbi:7-carboxy-7-deazaguanine synthase QueE [Idiomarina sp. UBA3162]|uniref:7-carboxy-7-deazaguanine synthase QueE n=1 Tax=unclassified Idiomarina TaxID=2614829 RepID=UPI000C8DA62C|nr:7-carboxy-7-deazaguanine synthase QueE [Idiomarina sp. UBA3162]MAD53973.1 7-carboxy-7-deazaguanine synthase QueE [Idiomarinaceae bacterium]MEC7644272.1 7-carboxy-7-deazaguanine synthase QueE [Pseudomonadota bacterium]|tara:strand:- start:4063 stop:4734 length:672 start_codon:yes stop_codon:yes gene_type:complete
MTYRINEIFETLQGEGTFTGVPSIFIRLQGCPVGCPWCDTQHTWDVKQEDQVSVATMMAKSTATSEWAEMSSTDIVELIKQRGYRAKHIVITGGEPAMYDLRALGEALEAHGMRLQIETSGTYELLITASTWVTVSPKLDMPGGYLVRSDCLSRADEIKHPVAMQKHIDALDRLLQGQTLKSDVVICLQPISQRPRATELAMKTCIERNWRLSVQMHKYLNIE